MRLNLIKRGEASPALLSSEFSTLTRACCGDKHCAGSRDGDGDELLRVMAKPGRPGEGWRRLKMQGAVMEETMKAGLQRSLLC